MYGQPLTLHLPYLPHDSQNEAVDRSFMAREGMLRALKFSLQKVVNKMKQQANKSRSERVFQVGDCVFSKLQSYKQKIMEKRKLDKLSPRYFGPYEVISKVGSVAYMLKLPEGARVHLTFHVSLLKGALILRYR